MDLFRSPGPDVGCCKTHHVIAKQVGGRWENMNVRRILGKKEEKIVISAFGIIKRGNQNTRYFNLNKLCVIISDGFAIYR
jgi:hypothetical protein